MSQNCHHSMWYECCEWPFQTGVFWHDNHNVTTWYVVNVLAVSKETLGFGCWTELGDWGDRLFRGQDIYSLYL